MSDASEILIENILQRARAEQQQLDQQIVEMERCRRQEVRLHEAFTRVQNFTDHHLWDKFGRQPTDQEFAEDYAQHLLTLGRELINQRERLSRGPEELISGDDDGKAFALAILRQAVRQDAAAVCHLLVEIMRAPSRLQNSVSYWLRSGLQQEIMSDPIPAKQDPDKGCQAAVSLELGTEEEGCRSVGGSIERACASEASRPEVPSGGGQPVDLLSPTVTPESRGEGVSTDNEPDRWLKVKQAASIAFVNPGVISRAANLGKLRNNGLRGAERRICALDLCRWIRERTARPEPQESDEHVNELVSRRVID
jgi:hypothetical protein